MPSDIRSFFGGGGGGPKPAVKQDNTPKKPEKKGRGRKVVSDDEEEEEVVKPAKTTTAKKKKAAEKAEEEETTSSAYFASKPKSTPIRTKAKPVANGTTPTKSTNGATPSTGRRSSRKTGKKNYNEDADDVAILEDEVAGDDDVHADNFKSRKADDDYEEGSSEDEHSPSKPQRGVNGKKQQTPTDDDGDVEMAEIPANDGGSDSKRKKASTAKTVGRKRKSVVDDEEEDDFVAEDEDEKPKKKAKTTKATPKNKAAKNEPREESKEMQAILDNIPTVRAPTPPPRDGDSKFSFKPGGGNASVAPMNAGMKEIPEGADDCLMGMTFVFTGVLETLGREEGQNLVKRYGGKVTTGPSKKTSYVVLGSDAGPKKLETIQSLGLKTINEDGLFALIRTMPAGGGSSLGAEAAAAKRAKDEEKIQKDAAEMERKEREKEKEAARIEKAKAARSGQAAPPSKPTGPKVEDRLWVDKYAPDTLQAVCGNKSTVEKLQTWLRNWRRNAHFGFKKAGADGHGIFRAAMLHGPPGIGKTTAAHLVANLEGYDVMEMNASDTRNKKLMEQTLKGVLDTTSILGYFAGDGKKVDTNKKNLVIIMDEVDGMSAGDRGGVGALAAVGKKTNVPIILICNERRLPKMKPFDFVTADFPFRRPTVDMIRSRIMSICFKEGIRPPRQVLDAIIEGSNADIRQIINMISTIKRDNKDLDFNDSKAMSKAWEKHVILKPWDIVSKIMRPQMFSPSSTATLNDKTELYFNDHEFSYLMLQENYLKSHPSRVAGIEGKRGNYEFLKLADQAAESISDGDLVDRMIHGSQQQWSLMPLHAIFSFVKPASYVYGNFNTQVGFSAWLGQNSKQNKLTRFVKEIQGHMRLRTSADRHEIRQQYLPALWDQTVAQMIKDGKEAVSEVIHFMDSYYLTKEDYDAIVELGVGPMDMDNPAGVKTIETQTKAAFTRTYNTMSHPMPFVKASNVLGMASGGKGIKREKPDLEEAIEDSEDDDAGAALKEGDATGGEVKEEEEDMDLSKDKYIKAPKKKAAPKGSAAGKGKKKTAAEDPDDEEEEQPKKKGKGGGGGGRKKK